MFFWHKHDNKTLVLCVGTPAEKEKLNVIQELNVAGGKYIQFFLYIIYDQELINKRTVTADNRK